MAQVQTPASAAAPIGQRKQPGLSFALFDPKGYANILTPEFNIQGSNTPVSSCDIRLVPSANQLWLRDDAGAAWIGPGVVGSNGTLQNAQCGINLATAVVSGAGNALSLNLPVMFADSYVGAKNIYAYVVSGTGSGSWLTAGTWTVPVAGPSVSPLTGAGSSAKLSLSLVQPHGADVAQPMECERQQRGAGLLLPSLRSCNEPTFIAR